MVLECTICGKVYKHGTHLRRHEAIRQSPSHLSLDTSEANNISVDRTESQFACPYCSKPFSRRSVDSLGIASCSSTNFPLVMFVANTLHLAHPAPTMSRPTTSRTQHRAKNHVHVPLAFNASWHVTSITPASVAKSDNGAALTIALQPPICYKHRLVGHRAQLRRSFASAQKIKRLSPSFSA